MRANLFLLALLACGFASEANAARDPPVDRCASDRSFVAFRARLRAAVARRDVAFLVSVTATDIASGPTGDGGRAGFIRQWRLDRPATSPIWAELGRLLALGCARDSEGKIWVPSMSRPDPAAPDGEGSRGSVVAVAPGAVLRVSPSDRARIVARVYGEAMTLAVDDDSRSIWANASADRGRQGWIRRTQIWDYMDRSAVFARRRGQWRLISFVSG